MNKRRANITLKQRAAQDRAYIESCFGRCFYPPEQLRKAEQELCTGVHLGCHLWFSAGVPSPAQAPTPEARQLAQQAELQAERNRAYYAKIRSCTAAWCCALLSRSATVSGASTARPAGGTQRQPVRRAGVARPLPER